MNKNPIYIVDDDRDDEHMIRESLKELGVVNEISCADIFPAGECN